MTGRARVNRVTAANTYDAFDLRCEVWLMWPDRHRSQFTRSVIRSNIRTIRRMEAAR